MVGQHAGMCQSLNQQRVIACFCVFELRGLSTSNARAVLTCVLILPHAAVYLQHNTSAGLQELIAIVRPVHRGGRNTNSFRFASLVDYWRNQGQNGEEIEKKNVNRYLKERSSVTSMKSQSDGAPH